MNQKKNVAIPAYNIIENHSDCISCANAIVNPLCPHCISKQFSEWIKSHPELQRETSKKLKDFVNKSEKRIGEQCAVCGNKVYICVYCFTDYLYQLVKEAGAGPKVLTEFLFIFNFDFKKIGYIHELEALGGY